MPNLATVKTVCHTCVSIYCSLSFILYLIYDAIYLYTAVVLTTGGSSTVHISTQTIHRTAQSKQTIHRTTQLTKWEECGRCPIFASYTLAFALQSRKKRGKTSVRVAEECQLARRNRIYRTEHI